MGARPASTGPTAAAPSTSAAVRAAICALLREHHPTVRAVGVDLSPGMAAEARQHAPAINADAARLPFPDGSVDRVLAPHMLYHCPDIPAAHRRAAPGAAPGRRAGRGDQRPRSSARAVGRVRGGHRMQRRASSSIGSISSTASFPCVMCSTRSGSSRIGGTLLVPDAAAARRLPREHVPLRRSRGRRRARRDPCARRKPCIDAEGVFRVRTRSGAFVCRLTHGYCPGLWVTPMNRQILLKRRPEGLVQRGRLRVRRRPGARAGGRRGPRAHRLARHRRHRAHVAVEGGGLHPAGRDRRGRALQRHRDGAAVAQRQGSRRLARRHAHRLAGVRRRRRRSDADDGAGRGRRSAGGAQRVRCGGHDRVRRPHRDRQRRRPGRPSSCPRPRAAPARSPCRSPRSSAAGWSASPAPTRSAGGWSTSSASTAPSTIAPTTSRRG